MLRYEYGTYFVSKIFSTFIGQTGHPCPVKLNYSQPREQHYPMWMQAGALKTKITLAISSYIWI